MNETLINYILYLFIGIITGIVIAFDVLFGFLVLGIIIITIMIENIMERKNGRSNK